MRSASLHPLYYDAGLEKWKARCRKRQKRYSDFYKGKQWHSYDCSKEEGRTRLRVMISLALFGTPMDGVALAPLAITPEQQREVAEYVDLICGLYKEKQQATVELITLMICVKSILGEGTTPVFRIRLDEDPEKIKFIDCSKVVYENWQDWLTRNKLPHIKCYPRNGSYAHPDEEHGDNNQVCPVEFANIPDSPSPEVASRRAMNEFTHSWIFFNGAEMQSESASLWQYVIAYKASMTNALSRSTLDRFLFQKGGCGTIEDIKRKIEFLSKIRNPDYLFEGLAEAHSIEIDCRTPETLLVSILGTETIPTPLNVNKVTFSPFDPSPPHLYKMSLLLKDHMTFTRQNLKFDRMLPHEAYKLEEALCRICMSESKIINAVVEASASKQLKVDCILDFYAVAELVLIYARPEGMYLTKRSDADKERHRLAILEKIEILMRETTIEEKKKKKKKNKNGKERKELDQFLAKIVEERIEAEKFSKSGDFVFESDLNAVYHNRKHGLSDFKTTSMQEYLIRIPDIFFIPENLRDITIMKDRICEIYCSEKTGEGDRDNYGMILRLPAPPPAAPTKWNPKPKKHKPLILTIHKSNGSFYDFEQELEKSLENNTFKAPIIEDFVP